MKKVFGAFFLWVFFPCLTAALEPMHGFHDLVAGEGSPGSEDGEFYSSRFSMPEGMAINPEGTQLFVADRENHCVRLVDLEHSNRVSTLAGTGKPGYLDGSLKEAAFNQPNALVFLPDRKIAVDDEGNSRIRLIDLNKGTVSTLAGTGVGGNKDGPAGAAQVGYIWNMVYLDSRKSLFFTQPGFGVLRELDLRTGAVTTVFSGKPEIPNPQSLCARDGKLYIADRGLQTIQELTFTEPSASTTTAFTCVDFAKGNRVLGMAWSGDRLYAVQLDKESPLVRLKPDGRPITFVSVWGEVLKNAESDGYFLDSPAMVPTALVSDPLSDRQLYLSHPFLNIITTFRDLDQQETSQGDFTNPDGLKDIRYPTRKPPKTFRILLIGDSHTSYVSDDESAMPKGFSDNSILLHFKDLPKRLELGLNSLAALENVPMRFEVLQYWKNSGELLNVWPYYDVPGLVQKFDVDLVLCLFHPEENLINAFYGRPLNNQQVPAENVDPEFILMPVRQRLQPGIARDLFELCEKKGLAKVTDQNQVQFSSWEKMQEDQEVADAFARVYSLPIKLMVDKLNTLKTTGGQTVRMETVFMPYPWLGQGFQKCMPLWGRILRDFGAPVQDLTPEIEAYRVSFFPITKPGDTHLNQDGHDLLTLWIEYHLIQNRVIPFIPEK